MRTATSGTSDHAGSNGWSGVRQGGRRLTQGLRGDAHHLVGDSGRLGRGHGQAHRREDVDVIALGDRAFHPVPVQRREWRSGGDQGTSVGPLVQLRRVRLGPARRVGQRKDDRSVGLAREFTHDGFGECARGGGQADQHTDIDMVDHVGEPGAPGHTPARHPAGRLGEPTLRGGEVGAIIGEQPVHIDDPDALRGSLFGQSLVHHLAPNHVEHTDAGRTGPEHDDLLLRQGAARDLGGTVQRSDRDRGGPLDVVVEGEEFVAVAGKDRQRMCGREVLPLQQHVGQLLAHRGDELIDERVVIVVVDTSVPPSQIPRVIEQFAVVGSHIEHDRQGASGVDTTNERVEGQLSDRDAHAADALIAQAEDPLSIGHHDHVDLTLGPVVQHLVKAVPLGVGHEQSPRPPVDLTETLACLPHCGRVDDRQSLGDVVEQNPVEQSLIAVLQRPKIDVLVQIIAASGEFVPAMLGLLFERLHRRRQQTQQTEAPALVLGEGGALGRQGIEQPGRSPGLIGHRQPPSVGLSREGNDGCRKTILDDPRLFVCA